MSIRVVSKGEQLSSGNGRKFMYNNAEEKPFVLQKVLNPSPLLYDRNEFPSLTENAIKSSNSYDSEGKNLKYSDKLKSVCQNQNFQGKSFNLNNDGSKNICSQVQNKALVKQHSSEFNQVTDKSRFDKKNNVQNSSQTNNNKSGFVDFKKSDVDSVKKFHKKQGNQLSKQYSFTGQSSGQSDFKNKSPKQNAQKSLMSVPNFTHSASKKASNFNCNISSKLTDEITTNKEIKIMLTSDKITAKTEHGKNEDAQTKKKKKRKSKVKRQVALQTGKITVLTPEVHFKIFNQSSALNSQNFKCTVTDINNKEEYPELGKAFVPTNQKENSLKKDSSAVEQASEVMEKISNVSVENQQIMAKEPLQRNLLDEKTVNEKKEKCDNKVVIHPQDPITVSFFDILLTKSSKAKIKDVKDETSTSNIAALSKIKMKQTVGHPHNLLDSSSPAIKRGKERENPKPKKPSHLKKIILLDRKIRREQLLHLKNSQAVNDVLNDNETESVDKFHNAENINTFDGTAGDLNIVFENTESSDFSSMFNDFHAEELRKEAIFLQHCEANNYDSSNEPISQTKFENSEVDESMFTEDIDKNGIKDFISQECNFSNKTEYSVLSSVCDTLTVTSGPTSKHLQEIESTDSLLKSLNDTLKTLEISEKEKAAKILLHTRNFREYCNHLISKDIDDAVYALLDDLARFQDRMHQKDPVKARMKRRMIYGVKEVKKYIKLKKLKCIVIAADIENVETEGGLNDILNDIKSLAVDHHIPCVFALSRKVLGKVCHKPVPVSCVGIFSYEGSEVNFKKMVELQIQSKKDYAEILKNLTLKLTEEKAVTLVKAKKEAPETLHALRSNILRDVFVPLKTENIGHANGNLEEALKMSEIRST